MGRRLPYRPHFEEPDIGTQLRRLPGSFHTREAAADDVHYFIHSTRL
jgi:hypothetical protein